MKKGFIVILLLVLGLFLLSNCAKDKGEDSALRAARFLLDTIPAAGMIRSGEARVYEGNSLWEYIDGGAELYHSYNFTEVATADYVKDSTELVADIYRFASSTDAYGIYSMIRPEKPSLVALGVEGFSSPLSLTFIKGVYMVRLTGYSESEATNQSLALLAKLLNDSLPGATGRPTPFLLFPVPNKIGLTDKYYAADFLGHKFLPRVYSLDFYLEPDTAALFLTTDESGDKFLQWSEYAKSIGSFEPTPDTLSFDSGLSFIITDNFYGRAAVGLKKGKLIGMVNYSPLRTDFLAGWIDSFQ